MIYVVQPNDSLYKIARQYGVNPDEIRRINQLDDFPYLVVGQALVVPTTETAYTVKPGDTLSDIARRYTTTVENILSLNPNVDPDRLQPGSVLRIPESAQKYGYIETNAYIEPSTPQKETALVNQVGRYLTYISPFSYRVTNTGTLIGIDDSAVRTAAKKYNVAPLMVVTNFAAGTFSTDTADTILKSEALQSSLINNMIEILKDKGYYGVNIDFERISPANRENYNNFLKKVVNALHPLKYVVSTALAPKASDYRGGVWHGAHDYKAHGEIVDFVVIMTYEWGWSGGPAYAVAPVDLVEEVVKYAVSVIPSRKIMMGMPLYGYDWTLPVTPGRWAKRISPQEAIRRASEVGAQIRFDEQTKSPTYKYYASNGQEHEVWFEDARSIEAKLKLVNKYDLRGVSYWVLGVSFPQNWIVLDNMYNIVKVVP